VSGGSHAPRHDPKRVVIAYEAQPTRMFGAYSVWATYADGERRAICHGTPHHCLAEAERLNAGLGVQSSAEQA